MCSSDLRGFFASSNIQVQPVLFQNWQDLEAQLRDGQIDMGLTSASAPLAMNLGLNGLPPWPAITPMTVTRSGNAICLAKRFQDLGVESLPSLAAHLGGLNRPLRLAIGEQGSMQELLLRHWLASGGIHPDTDLELTVLSPMAMQAALQAGEIDGFIAGRYRVAKAVESEIGRAHV